MPEGARHAYPTPAPGYRAGFGAGLRGPVEGDGALGAIVCALCVVGLTLFVLIGDPLLDPLPVARLREGFAAMVPATALVALLTAVSLLLWARERRGAGRVVAAAVLAFALFRLAETVVGVIPETGPQDRVATGTALGLGLVALSLVLSPGGSAWAARVVEISATVALVTATMVLTGYAFDASTLSSTVVLSGVSVLSAMTIFLLATGSLVLNLHRNWLRFLIGTSREARRAQMLLLPAILAVFAVTVALLFATAQGYVSTRLSHALLADLMVVLAVTTVVLMARAQQVEAARLRRDLDWLTTVLDATAAAAMVVDAEGHTLLANQQARRIAGPGRDPGAWLAETPFFAPGTLALLDGARHPRALLTEGTGRAGLRACSIGPDGATLILVFHARRIDDVALTGRSLTIVTIVDDTDNWTAREGLARVERLETVGLMAGGAAHEFANILGVIRLTADVGVMKADGAERDHFQTIGRACERGEGLTGRLLSLSREVSPDPVPTDLSLVLAEVRQILAPVVPARIELELLSGDEPMPALVDRIELEAAVLNLTINAVHAIEAQPAAAGQITVALEQQGPWAEISVRDDGIGMNHATAQRAVTPFFTTRPESGGTGLGLSMVDAFARRSGGELVIDSVPGVGTRVLIRLPLMPDGHDLAAEAGPQGGAVPRSLEGLGILVVEGDLPRRRALLRQLRLLGVEAVVADDAEAALALLRERPFDLVLVDRGNGNGNGNGTGHDGGADGLTLLRTIGATYPDLARLLVTGLAAPATPVQDTDGVMVLRRPVAMRTLANAMRIALAFKDQSDT